MACVLPPQPPDQLTLVDDEKSVNFAWHKWFLDIWTMLACLKKSIEAIVIPTAADIVAGGMVPFYIAPTETFVVPLYKQALFEMTIDNQGILVVDGFLIQVT